MIILYKIGIENRIKAGIRDSFLDVSRAFKIIISPQFKMPICDFISYFTNLFANKIPGIRKVVGQKRIVDFSEYMKAYDRTAATFTPYRELLARIVDLMSINNGDTVLDLGSGTGNLSLAAKRSGAKVISADNSAEAREVHKSKDLEAIQLDVNIDRDESRTGFIPFADHSFKKVCAANLWTYIKNRSTLYAEIRRLLEPDGIFVLAVERKGYSPVQILKGHLSSEYNKHISEGMLPLTALTRVYADFISSYEDLLITAEQTKKLMRGITAGDYVVFTEQEIIREFKANGFEVLSAEIAYASQAIIVRARVTRTA